MLGSSAYSVTPQFATSPCASIARICCFGHLFDQITKAEDDDLVGHDEHPRPWPAVVQTDRGQDAAQPQDDVTPALAAGRTMIELAHPGARLRLIGKPLLDAHAREPVENAELLLAQPFIDDGAAVRLDSALVGDVGCGLASSQVGRGKDCGWPAVGAEAGEPSAKGGRLFVTEWAERNVDVALGDLDHRAAGRVGGVPGEIAGALTVADNPQVVGPAAGNAFGRRGHRTGLKCKARARRPGAVAARGGLAPSARVAPAAGRMCVARCPGAPVPLRPDRRRAEIHATRTTTVGPAGRREVRPGRAHHRETRIRVPLTCCYDPRTRSERNVLKPRGVQCRTEPTRSAMDPPGHDR